MAVLCLCLSPCLCPSVGCAVLAHCPLPVIIAADRVDEQQIGVTSSPTILSY